MSRHATAEMLSAYLDDELPPPKLRLVEQHLEDCEECRQRLEGLRRVVRRLHRLEAVAPPPVLAQTIQRRVALEARPSSLVEHLESRLKGLPIEPSVSVTFALVFAFAVILYLFAQSVDRHQNRTTFIVAPAPVTETEPPRQLAGRTFERFADLWIEEGLAEVTGEELTILSPESEGGQNLLRRIPELASLLAAGDSIRLRDGDRVVELRSRPVETIFP